LFAIYNGLDPPGSSKNEHEEGNWVFRCLAAIQGPTMENCLSVKEWNDEAKTTRMINIDLYRKIFSMEEKELQGWFKHQLTIKNDEMAGETNRWLHVYSATGPSTSSPTEERAAVPEPSTNAPQQSAPCAAPSSSASATTPGLVELYLSKRHTGIVKMWCADKGFGFVVPDREDMQGQDLFVHCTKIANGDFLVPNRRVDFAMGWNERRQKWQAVDVWMLP